MKVKKLKEILNKLSDSDPIMEKEIIVHKLGSPNISYDLITLTNSATNLHLWIEHNRKE